MRRLLAARSGLLTLAAALCALLVSQATPALAKPAEMVYVAGGAFTMGRDTAGYREFVDGPAHAVTLGNFYIGRYNVTFGEYDAFCLATGRKLPDDMGWGRADRPAVNVSWQDAVDYCNWRSRLEGLTPCYTVGDGKVVCNFAANGYRLPTEGEWEYAARGGSVSKGYKYSGSNDISAVGLGYGDRTHPAGLKLPNELGIYDMTGNVWQWCWDWYDKDYYRHSPDGDPAGPASGSARVIRGGGYVFAGGGVTVFDRSGDKPSRSGRDTSFRLARTYGADGY